MTTIWSQAIGIAAPGQACAPEFLWDVLHYSLNLPWKRWRTHWGGIAWLLDCSAGIVVQAEPLFAFFVRTLADVAARLSSRSPAASGC